MKNTFNFKFSNLSFDRIKSKLVKNAILVSAEKVMAPIPIPKFNPGFDS